MRQRRQAVLPPRKQKKGPFGSAAKGVLLLFCMALALGASGAAADEIVLTNGDRLTGTIEHVRDGKLSLKTPYSKDPVKIDWSSVKGLSTTAPIKVKLEDGSIVEGPAVMTEEGVMQIIPTGAGPVVIGDLSAIKGINPPSDITYKGHLTAGAGYTTGNTNTANGNIDGKFVVRSKRQRGTLMGAWNYAEDSGTVSARNANGSLKYDFFITKRFYAYVNSLLEYDSFQNLNLRATLGGGAGYQILDSSRVKLSGELGVSYVNDDYSIPTLAYVSWIAGITPFPANPNKAYAAGRWSVDLDWKIIPDKIVLFHFHEGYFGFEDPSNLLIRSKSGMRFTLYKDFFTSIQGNLDFNNQPAAGKDKVDLAIIFGLGYAFDL
jgi:putative salt-induced outer membrane protein YdiY